MEEETSKKPEEEATEKSLPASPRDSATAVKRPCVEGIPGPSETTSQTQPSPTGYMVPPSPPKFVSIEEIMKAAHGVSNMVLAHEIAVDNEFTIEKVNAPENSLEKQVKEIMHKAFWDLLEESLGSDPPEYDHALILLKEVKENLLEILPTQGKMKAHINEVLDIDLIRQKAENDALDVRYYGEFVVDLMSKLCAPARDEMVAQIREKEGVVALFREILRVMEILKMDIANFTIQQIRPFIQQQSVDYERKKFLEFLKAQQENNLDGLQYTRDWLARGADKLMYPDSPQEGAAAAGPQPTPVAILNNAYLELLQWEETKSYPETLLMDAGRLSECGDRVARLTVIASVLLVTYNTIGAPIAGIRDLKTKLKDHTSIILADTPVKELPTVMENVAEQVIKEVSSSLVKHGFSALDDTRRSLLHNQITTITSESNPVYNIIQKRVDGFILQLISTNQPQRVQLPAGLSAVSEELNKVCGQFLRLISHNRAVFGMHYAEIIEPLHRRTQVPENNSE